LRIDEYWDLTVSEYEKYIEAYKVRKEMEAKEMDVNNYNLGKYIAIAFNNPKKYPRRPFLQEEEKKMMTAEDFDRVMRRNTILLGGKINDTGTDSKT